MSYKTGDLAGKSVTTGKRNVNPATDMAPGNTSLPVKPYTFEGVTPGRRYTTLDAGGEKSLGGK